MIDSGFDKRDTPQDKIDADKEAARLWAQSNAITKIDKNGNWVKNGQVIKKASIPDPDEMTAARYFVEGY